MSIKCMRCPRRVSRSDRAHSDLMPCGSAAGLYRALALDALLHAVVINRGNSSTALDLDALGARDERAIALDNVHAQPLFVGLLT